MTDTIASAGWYPNPDGTANSRYFDGTNWTAYHTAGTGALSDDQRAALFNAAIAQEVANGARVESLGEHIAVVVYGTKANHVLHALLTFLTCGLWLLVWLLVAAESKEERRTLTIDAYGVINGLPEPSIYTWRDGVRQVLWAVAILTAIVLLIVIFG